MAENARSSSSRHENPLQILLDHNKEVRPSSLVVHFPRAQHLNEVPPFQTILRQIMQDTLTSRLIIGQVNHHRDRLILTLLSPLS